MKTSVEIILLTAFLILLSASANAQDWTGWRGANRDGVIKGFAAPGTWPDKLNLKWKVQAGEGHSSPLVAGNRVYLHSRRAENEVVAAFDLSTGKELWSDSYPVSYTMHPAATGHGKGPKSTPVASDGKLYSFGITGIISCYTLQNGKLRWRKDFTGQYKTTSPYFGTAMSPVVAGSLLIAHVGGHDSGALTAFNTETGEIKWTWKGDGPGYASPIVVEIDGLSQIVTQSQQNIIGIALATGELLWKIPFDTAYVQNIVTPLVYQKTLILSGIDKGVFAVRVFKQGKEWKTETLWHNKAVSMYMSSPVMSGDLLFGLSHKNKGQYFCLDAKTGKTLWTSEPRQGENSAILLAGDLLFLLGDDAEMTIIRKSATGFEAVKKYSVAESATWAHPVVLRNQIIVKDVSSLALWSID